MKYLLDTHTLLWAANDPGKLSTRAKTLLKDGRRQAFVSAATAWEIATKVRLGKLADPSKLLSGFEAKIVQEGYGMLSVSITHAVRAGSFLELHQDPFDRMLAAQALIERLTMISADKYLDVFGVQRVW